MRAFCTGLVSVGAVIFLCDLAPAQRDPDDYRRSMGNLRPGHRTAVPAIQGSPPPNSSQRRRSGNTYVYRPRYPVYDYGYYGRQYYPYGWDYYTYPSWYQPNYWYRNYSAPLVMPEGALFGPRAAQRFLEGDRPVVPQRAVVVRDADDDVRVPAPAARGQLAAARRFIGFGDAHFRGGKYSEALRRYRSAAKASPMLGDAYFRQGYALMAAGRYEPAVRAIRRGLGFDPNWARSGFHNDDLYGEDAATKAKHIDALATAAADAPDDADFQFLFGVCLYFDGRLDQAAPFFDHAARLSGDDTHIVGFLPQNPENPDQPEK